MSGIDWAIVAGALALLIAGVAGSRRYMQSVADFLAAGRTAGRYLLTVSQGVSELGAISMVPYRSMIVPTASQ